MKTIDEINPNNAASEKIATGLKWEIWNFRRPGYFTTGEKATSHGFTYYISLEVSGEHRPGNWYDIEIDCRRECDAESLTLRCSRRTITEAKKVASMHHQGVSRAFLTNRAYKVNRVDGVKLAVLSQKNFPITDAYGKVIDWDSTISLTEGIGMGQITVLLSNDPTRKALGDIKEAFNDCGNDECTCFLNPDEPCSYCNSFERVRKLIDAALAAFTGIISIQSNL